MAGVRGGYNGAAIRAESTRPHLIEGLSSENDGLDGVAMVVQGPNTNRPVVGAGDHVGTGSIEGAVATGSARSHGALMASENDGLAGPIGVPYPRRLIEGVSSTSHIARDYAHLQMKSAA